MAAAVHLREDDSFIAKLLESVWAHAFLSKQPGMGCPYCAVISPQKGPTIRGRLDVAAALRLIAVGGDQTVSIGSERSLDHAASDATVAAPLAWGT